jgi:hypothetical protein
MFKHNIYASNSHTLEARQIEIRNAILEIMNS